MKTIATARGVCPNCRRNLPIGKAFWGLGKIFECKGCGASLFIDNVQFGKAAAGFALLVSLGQLLPFWWVMLAGLLLGYLDWLFMPVRLIDGKNAIENESSRS
ncbi:MAG: hypothetical protein V2I43_22065 [Parvularcula sp.]|jgi:hypothetical protein|nr:hypothetical protein [Parvularcula sp.]